MGTWPTDVANLQPPRSLVGNAFSDYEGRDVDRHDAQSIAGCTADSLAP
jgi:hypothetical protein